MGGQTKLLFLSCCLISLASLAGGNAVPSTIFAKNCPAGWTSYNFNGTRISEIGKDFLAGSSPACLELQGTGITSIAPGAFDKLTKLTNLYLSRNWVKNIENLLSFGAAKSLRSIVIDQAQIGSRTHRPVLELSQIFPELRQLSLRDNAYVSVKHTGVVNKVVQGIDVSKTNVVVQWNVFPKLEQLDLSGNVLETWSFPGLLPPTMLGLDVSRNSLTYFHGEYMPKLRTLLLHSNRINRIDSRMLQTGSVLLYGLKELRVLSLAFNQLRTINCQAFKDVPQLETLDLSGNSLSTIQKGCFDSMLKLRSLNLTSNGLTKVLEINGTMNLENLDLAFNRIKDLPANVFAKMTKLKTLNLSGNELTSIHANAFASLGRLEELDLSMNMLRALPANWITPLKMVQTLKLNSNEITTLKSLPIGKTSTLRHLYLENNPLANLTADVFDNLPKALVIYVNSNALHPKYSFP